MDCQSQLKALERTGKLTQLRIHVFGGMALLACSLHLSAEAENDSMQRVDAKSVPVIRLNDGRQRPFAELWDKYKASPSAEYRRVIVSLMTERENMEVTDSIDRDICSSFAEIPTADAALLLGMCNSGRSRDLLRQHTEATNAELAEACRLGLARRGDKAAEAFFIEKYVEQSRGQTKGADGNQVDALIASVCRLEYIGSVDAILAVFDSVGLDAISSADGVAVKRDTAANMRAFLAQVGVPVPSAPSEKELKQWWGENRDAVGKILRDKKDLPRLKMSRVIKSSR